MEQFHYRMLEDKIRLDAYNAAIRKTVRQGDIVVDIGGGTGILSMMAAACGAKKVYCIEASEIAIIASEVVDHNGYGNVISVINKDLRDVELPERADVLIGEILGSFGIEEDVLKLYHIAVEKFLKDDGRTLPRALSLFAAPTYSRILQEMTTFWDSISGLDYEPVKKRLEHLVVIEEVEETELLEAPNLIGQFSLKDCENFDINQTTRFTFSRNADINAYCGWFSTELCEGITLDNSPFSPQTHWKQIIFPVLPAVSVRKGDSVEVCISSLHYGDAILFNWFSDFNLSGELYKRQGISSLRLKVPDKVTDWFKPQNSSSVRLSKKGLKMRDILSGIRVDDTLTSIKKRLSEINTEHDAELITREYLANGWLETF